MPLGSAFLTSDENGQHTLLVATGVHSLNDFKDWIKDLAEGRDGLKKSSSKVVLDDNSTPNATRTKPGSNFFASVTESSQRKKAAKKVYLSVLRQIVSSANETSIHCASALLPEERKPPNAQKTVAAQISVFSAVMGSFGSDSAHDLNKVPENAIQALTTPCYMVQNASFHLNWVINRKTMMSIFVRKQHRKFVTKKWKHLDCAPL